MSRGLGRVERDVLASAEQRRGEVVRMDELTQQFEHHPESIRRAMKSLARKGYATTEYFRGRFAADGSLIGGWIPANLTMTVKRWELCNGGASFQRLTAPAEAMPA